MDLGQLVVLVIAAYGAILSTIIYVQKWLENKPKIVIDYYFWEPTDIRRELYVMLVVRNYGKKSITLSCALLQAVPEKEHEFVEPLDFIDGTEVASGKNYKIPFSVYHAPTNWVNNKVQIIGIVEDQLGNEYRSEIIERDPKKI